MIMYNIIDYKGISAIIEKNPGVTISFDARYRPGKPLTKYN